MIRLAWEFFRRDATIALTYRFSFAVQLLGNFVILGLFYFIGKTLGPEKIPVLAPFGGNFLAFLLVGIALGDCVGVSLTTFATQIREGQLTGTLEATLMSAVPLPLILLFSSLWSYFFSFVRFLIYLIFGSIMYGVELGDANIPVAGVVFLLTVAAFMGIGILWASVVMIIKRGEAVMTLVGYIVILAGGVLFPATVLPGWLQVVSELIPLTHALEAMRFALLQGAALSDVTLPMIKLTAFALTMPLIGFAAFAWSTHLAKRHGSLTEF